MIINNKKLAEPIRVNDIYGTIVGLVVLLIMLGVGYSNNYYVGSDFLIPYVLMMFIIIVSTYLSYCKYFYVDNDKIEYRGLFTGKRVYSYSDINSCRVSKRISTEITDSYQIVLTMKDGSVIKIKDSMNNYGKLKRYFLDKNIL